MSEAPCTEPTTKETYRQDAERPLTADDFYQAIEKLRFAVGYDGFNLQASKNPQKKKPLYSQSDIESAIAIFTKLSMKDHPLFRFSVFEGGHHPEESMHRNSPMSTLRKINYITEGSELCLFGLIAFVATLIHGAPVLKKHPKTRTKDMEKTLQKFKIFFEIDEYPDYFLTPLVDLALYARDQIKGLKAT